MKFEADVPNKPDYLCLNETGYTVGKIKFVDDEQYMFDPGNNYFLDENDLKEILTQMKFLNQKDKK